MTTPEPERQVPLETHLPADVAFDELLERFGNLSAFRRDHRSSSSAISSVASRDQRSAALNPDPQRAIVLTGESRGRFQVHRSRSRRQRTEIFEHPINIPIEPIGGDNRGRLTHTQLQNTESHAAVGLLEVRVGVRLGVLGG
jgi:hypothetical protein